MNFFLAGLMRMGARKLAANPRVRATAARAARATLDEAKRVAGAPDRPRAAGRAVRRILDRLRDGE